MIMEEIMEEKKIPLSREEESHRSPQPGAKKHWQEPRLAFVEPKLTKHGDLKGLTQGDPFFGPFSPPPP